MELIKRKLKNIEEVKHKKILTILRNVDLKYLTDETVNGLFSEAFKRCIEIEDYETCLEVKQLQDDYNKNKDK
jgi:D-hexose-6-phosphate mutarotase